MKSLPLILLIGFCAIQLLAQETNSSGSKKSFFIEGKIPNKLDSLYQQQLPELSIEETDSPTTLPWKVDNSTLPYLRPVFTQTGASCGQASAVAYNFGYEMCLARNESADTSVHQYPTHFAYNFENGGDAYFGVSYFHSFEILKKCGTMNVSDYGGLADDGKRWISGYNVYRNAMSNRIEDVYTIKTNTYKGILTLKNWIYNHLGNSIIGGVASFYAGSPYNSQPIAAGTPEAGKHIMVNFPIPAAHAMCIVGYNDSVRFDFNHDGQYTNHIDLTGDGIVDVRDWEIGAFKFVNSYGVDPFAGGIDSGFCYMMYKTLAETYDNGGIWNTCVHVIIPKPAYQPKLALKVKLKHNRRGSVKVSAGIGSNTNSYIPEHEIDFPIFDYQGGNHFMQGYETNDTMQIIEFGLDITPLLSYCKKNTSKTIFLLVDENDPSGQSSGKILSASIMDYTGSQVVEIPFNIDTEPIKDNTRTCVVKTYTSKNEKIEINTTQIPPFVVGQAYETTLSASGGNPPYSWSVVKNYYQQNNNTEFQAFVGTKIVASQASDSVMPVALPFGFPFYGKVYDTVYVNMNNGYLQFTKDKIPWPYYNDELPLFRSYKLILPLSNQFVNSFLPDHGAWYEADNQKALFRWQLSMPQGAKLLPYNTWLQLSPDGTIKFWHENIEIPPYYKVYSGISNGDKENFDLKLYTKATDANFTNFTQYIPYSQLNDAIINNEGKLQFVPVNDSIIYPIIIKATDSDNVSTIKEFIAGNGLIFSTKIRSGADSIIELGETGLLDLILTNQTSSPIANLTAKIKLNGSKIVFVDSICNVPSIAPNSVITIHDAFKFVVTNSIDDYNNCLADITFSSPSFTKRGKIVLKSIAPLPKAIAILSTKPNNEPINPGEAAIFIVRIENSGKASAKNVNISIEENSELNIPNNTSIVLPILLPGEIREIEFEGSINKMVPLGTILKVPVKTKCDRLNERCDTLTIRAGRCPVLVIDLDIANYSAPVIYEKIKAMGYLSDYAKEVPNTINEYQSIFINLGRQTNRHILSYSEAYALMSYLDNGGCIYMEGRNTWRDDPISPLHPRFLVSPVNKFFKIDTISGITNEFTQGLSYLYSGPASAAQYYITPTFTAFPILKVDNYEISVANDANIYKTIASTIDIAGLQSLNTLSTIDTLLLQYMNFFKLRKSLHRPEAIFSEKNSILCVPNPANSMVSISITQSDNTRTQAEIFSQQGARITTLSVPQYTTENSCTFIWDLKNDKDQRVKSGIYLCRITTGKQTYTGKIIVL